MPFRSIRIAARRARLVEAQVEAQAVQGQVGAQGVGSSPGHPLTRPGGGNVEHLLQDGQAQEEESDPHKVPLSSWVSYRVDEYAQNLRVEQLQADAGE